MDTDTVDSERDNVLVTFNFNELLAYEGILSVKNFRKSFIIRERNLQISFSNATFFESLHPQFT